MDGNDYAEMHRRAGRKATHAVTLVQASLDQFRTQVESAKALTAAALGNSSSESALNASGSLDKISRMVEEIKAEANKASAELNRFLGGF